MSLPVPSPAAACLTPPRAFAVPAQITASNDGFTFSANAAVTSKGPGSYLTFNYTDSQPWGPWTQDNATFPSQGGALQSLYLTGVFTNGEPDGGYFLNTGRLFCAYSSSHSLQWASFGPVAFKAGGPWTRELDTQLVVAPSVSTDYATAIQVDVVYQVVITPAGGAFWWRRNPLGTVPQGLFSDPIPLSTAPTELELGVTVTFSTVTKNPGDSWLFTSSMANPSIVPATFNSYRKVVCPVPSYRADYPDADPATPGLQHEVKVSDRGSYCFSNVTVGGPWITLDVAGGQPSVLSGDARMYVTGFYTGTQQMVYNLQVLSAGNGSAAPTFQWRTYAVHPDPVLTPWSAPVPLSMGYSLLEQDVWVKWATLSNKLVGGSWTFTAYPYWSVPYSPVANLNASAGLSATTRLLPEGVYIGPNSTVYQVYVPADVSTFMWRKWAYGADPSTAGAFSATLSTSQAATPIEAGLTVRWTYLPGVQAFTLWQFSAFSGHVASFAAGPFLSQASPGAGNAPGDPGPPLVTGTYLGTAAATYTVLIGDGVCSTSCSAFRFSVNGGALSPVVPSIMQYNVPIPLSYGVQVTWPDSSGFQAGNTYAIVAKPLPTSILLPVPDPNGYAPASFSTAGSTYSASSLVPGWWGPQGGWVGSDAPPQNVTITVDFPTPATFTWRNNTDAYSAPQAIVPSARPAPRLCGCSLPLAA